MALDTTNHLKEANLMNNVNNKGYNLKNNYKNITYNLNPSIEIRSELEYHINILAAEIMNRIFQTKFKNREEIVILLPTCMRIPKSECFAIEDNLGLKCISCNENCNIGKVNKKFSNVHTSIYIVSHVSSILSNLSNEDKKK